MVNFKLIMQYDGARYKGWQRLGNQEQTVQGRLERALTDLTGQPIEVIGSSRTDAGVHALAQAANFHAETSLSAKQILDGLHHLLPADIAVTEAVEVDPRFHARYAAQGKSYVYKIWNAPHANPFMRKYSLHVNRPLDLAAVREGCSAFVGEHDFTAYTNAKSNKKKAVRRIFSMDAEERDGFVIVRVQGNGFLYNMVRKMVGTLVEVGLGGKHAKDIPHILASKERVRTGGMADACGLYLERVLYEDQDGPA